MPLSFGAPRLGKWLSERTESFGFNWLYGGLLLGGLVCAFTILPWPEPLFASGFWCCVIVIAKSDLAFYLIPDAATFVLAGFGLTRAIVLSFPRDAGAPDGEHGLWASIASALLAFALFFVTSWIYERLTGREGLGFGDVKLAGALGLWLDPRAFALALELAAFTGFLLVFRHAIKGQSLRQARLPLGALLAPAGFAVYFASCLPASDLSGASLP